MANVSQRTRLKKVDKSALGGFSVVFWRNFMGTEPDSVARGNM